MSELNPIPIRELDWPPQPILSISRPDVEQIDASLQVHGKRICYVKDGELHLCVDDAEFKDAIRDLLINAIAPLPQQNTVLG